MAFAQTVQSALTSSHRCPRNKHNQDNEYGLLSEAPSILSAFLYDPLEIISVFNVCIFLESYISRIT